MEALASKSYIIEDEFHLRKLPDPFDEYKSVLVSGTLRCDKVTLQAFCDDH